MRTPADIDAAVEEGRCLKADTIDELLGMIEGMDVVDEIANGYVDYEDRPQEEQVMKKVTVETFGEEYPEPEKL